MIEKIEYFIVYIFNFRKINKMTEDELERFLLEERIEDMLNHE